MKEKQNKSVGLLIDPYGNYLKVEFNDGYKMVKEMMMASSSSVSHFNNIIAYTTQKKLFEDIKEILK